MTTVIRVVICVLLAIIYSVARVDATSFAPGDLLVAGEGPGTVQIFSSGGTDLGLLAAGLNAPAWITADAAGNIWVSEFQGQKIDEFSPSGANVLTINTPYQPGDVRIGGDGTVYVADYFNGRVFRYKASSGNPLGLFASTPFTRADFMAFDAAGNLYITNFDNGAIRRVSPTGADLGNFVTGFIGVEGIAFDASGNLYAANAFTNVIKRFSPTGGDLGMFASVGQGSAYGLAFDASGNIFVSNITGNAIDEFSPSGVSLGSFASDNPRDVAIAPSEPSLVPEPSTLGLIGLGLIGLLFKSRRPGGGVVESGPTTFHYRL